MAAGQKRDRDKKKDVKAIWYRLYSAQEREKTREHHGGGQKRDRVRSQRRDEISFIMCCEKRHQIPQMSEI